MTRQAEHFLSGIYHPINRSNLVLALAAGTVIQVDSLPVDLLPTVTLLAVIGVRRFNQQIVDDYVALLRRMREVLAAANAARTIEETGERFNHPEFHLVSCLVCMFLEEEGGARWLDDFPEAWYMPAVYEELINTDLKSLF